MTTYLALLRGINVGGANKVGMKELRTLFEELGYEGAQTYLQSGNVVFEAKSSTSKKLVAEIEGAIAKVFKLNVSVIVRTHRELENVATGNPFPTEDVKPAFLHVKRWTTTARNPTSSRSRVKRSFCDSRRVRGGQSSPSTTSRRSSEPRRRRGTGTRY